MNIIVPAKQVPNTTGVRVDPKTGNLIREGIDSVINPEDRHALEAALSVKARRASMCGTPRISEHRCRNSGLPVH